MRPKHSSNGKRNVGFYSFSPNMQNYLYNVANVYNMISGNVAMRIGNEEIVVGDEGKKLFALYLAAGFNSVHDSKTKTMLHNSLAYREVYSRFGKSGIFKSKKGNISQDEVSEIISQDFSELLNDRSNEFCNMKYLTIPALITMQTLKVAKSGEVNPIYWSCKMTDGIKDTNFAEDYVSNVFSMYQDAVKRDYLSVKWPLTRGVIKKKVSIEEKKSITKSSKEDRKSSEVEEDDEATLDERLKEFFKRQEEREQAEAEQRKRNAEMIATIEREGRQKRSEAMRTINQSTAEYMENVARVLGINLYQSSSDTTSHKHGTSDSSEMSKMFDDKAAGDSSKSSDKGRHL